MRLKPKIGQNAIEYLLLLALMVGIVLVALKTEVPRSIESAEVLYNKTSEEIVGEAPECGVAPCDGWAEEDAQCPECF